MAMVVFWWVFIDGFLAASITSFAVRAVFLWHAACICGRENLSGKRVIRPLHAMVEPTVEMAANDPWP